MKDEELQIENLDFKAKYQMSINDKERFFGYYADKLISWDKKYTQVYNGSLEDSKWFVNGKLNVCYNCVDRHCLTNPDKVGLVYSDNFNNSIEYTYNDILFNVLIYANLIKELSIDSCITIYLPMSDEACFIALACARLGIPHNVVFGGYSSESLKKRMRDCKSKTLFTTRLVDRENKKIDFEKNAINAIYEGLENIVFVDLNDKKKAGNSDLISQSNNSKNIPIYKIEVVEQTKLINFKKTENPGWVNCNFVDSEHPLFYLYTSGSTGNPKGLIHSTAGYLLHITLTLKNSFSFDKSKKMFCSADLGWITGHSYSLYAPLCLGATTLIMNGSPFYPLKERFFQLIESFQITHFYTAPTAIRMLRKILDSPVTYNTSSLELIGCVGEPINKSTYDWYSKTFNAKVIDTYFQTETGGFLITPVVNESNFEGECTGIPTFGVNPVIVVESVTGHESTVFEMKQINTSSSKLSEHSVFDVNGRTLRLANEGELGLLLIKGAFPGLARGVLNDRDRYLKAYFSLYPGYYLTGDEAFTKNNHIFIRGRADDVINVSGHRMSTAELESAVCSHLLINESAVVGVPDEITGESVHVFIVCNESFDYESELKALLRTKIGALLRVQKIYNVKSIPKTRTGKIMRRVLKAIIMKKPVGDVSTCANVESITEILNTFVI